jgi:hypothetical protein
MNVRSNLCGVFILVIITLFFFQLILPIKAGQASTYQDSTHTILAEFGTATW